MSLETEAAEWVSVAEELVLDEDGDVIDERDFHARLRTDYNVDVNPRPEGTRYNSQDEVDSVQGEGADGETVTIPLVLCLMSIRRDTPPEEVLSEGIVKL